jgi:hypothetical protein
MSDPMERALRLLESCQMPGFDPENAETYPAVEEGTVNSIGNALVAAQVLATLAVAGELRTLNSDHSQWYREVLEVLTAAKDSSICDSERELNDVGLVKCGLRRGHDKEHRGSIEGRRFMWP